MEVKKRFYLCVVVFFIVILSLIYYSDKSKDSSDPSVLDSPGRSFNAWRDVWESQR